jgi:hypothetical protein
MSDVPPALLTLVPSRPDREDLYDLMVYLWNADQVLKSKGHSLSGLLNHASKNFFGVELGPQID